MQEWNLLAPYYDLYFNDRTIDIDFWVNCAKVYGPEVLEFSCGTGRLTLPMVKSGAKIVGIDISRPMLSILEKKLKKELRIFQMNVTVYCKNATQFSFPNKRFSAIFSPWGFPAVTIDEQNSLMQCVRKHLGVKSIFVVDIYNFKEPTVDLKHFEIQDCKFFPEKQLTIMRGIQQQVYANIKIGHFLFLWDIIKSDGTLKRIITERTERIYSKNDMERLLNKNGFKILQLYGDYDRSDWKNNSPRTIIISQKQ